jgi:hypothetical protein
MMYLLVSQHISGIIMPTIGRTVQSRQRLWCTALAVMQQTRGGEVVRCALVGTTSSPRVYCSTASAVHHRLCRFCTVLLMMGMMMPETCWETNKYIIFCIWLVIYSPSWFKMHGHMKPKERYPKLSSHFGIVTANIRQTQIHQTI